MVDVDDFSSSQKKIKMPQAYSSLATGYPSWNEFPTRPGTESTNLRTGITRTRIDSQISGPGSTEIGTDSKKMDRVRICAHPYLYGWLLILSKLHSYINLRIKKSYSCNGTGSYCMIVTYGKWMNQLFLNYKPNLSIGVVHIFLRFW